MSNNAFGLIYTGEGNPRMRDLASSRAVAAIPFGGRYRVIDFILSNYVSSGVTSVGVIAQRNYHSLMDHLGSGAEWDLARKREGLFVLPPFMTKDSVGLSRGSVDAFRTCLGYIRRCPDKYLILSGSHTLFNMDFDEMLEQHIATGADITIMYSENKEEFNPEDQNKDLRLFLNNRKQITAMELDSLNPQSDLQSCDVFLMDKELFAYLIEEAYARGEYHFVRDILLKKVSSLKMYGWRYDGLVYRLNSVDSYFRASMDMLNKEKRNLLMNGCHPILTKMKDEVPTHYYSDANVNNSLLADGCEIRGNVENSVLFRGCRVGKNSVIKNSILMQGAVVGDNVTLDNVIMDKGVEVRAGRTLIGYDGFPLVIRKNAVI